MNINFVLAATEQHPSNQDPATAAMAITISIIIWITAAWYMRRNKIIGPLPIPYPLERYIDKVEKRRAERKEAEKYVWFDPATSVLRRGPRQVEIPAGTVEYFVCELVFTNPTDYQTDTDVLEAAGQDNFKQRTVYQAVNRVNEKAKRQLGLKDNLLERLQGKESTRLNKRYF